MLKHIALPREAAWHSGALHAGQPQTLFEFLSDDSCFRNHRKRPARPICFQYLVRQLETVDAAAGDFRQGHHDPFITYQEQCVLS